VKHALWFSLVGWLVLGCHHDKEAEGPMERAGKHVDHAAEKTGQALEKAAHKTGEAFEKAGKKLKGNDAPPPAPSPKPAE